MGERAAVAAPAYRRRRVGDARVPHREGIQAADSCPPLPPLADQQSFC
jgi:hypothetical protein